MNTANAVGVTLHDILTFEVIDEVDCIVFAVIASLFKVIGREFTLSVETNEAAGKYKKGHHN